LKQNLSIIGDPLVGKSDNRYRKSVNDDESSQHFNDDEYLGSVRSKIDQITKGKKPIAADIVLKSMLMTIYYCYEVCNRLMKQRN
jgi:hypothetical protein